jgi:hypothetical protein
MPVDQPLNLILHTKTQRKHVKDARMGLSKYVSMDSCSVTAAKATYLAKKTGSDKLGVCILISN